MAESWVVWWPERIRSLRYLISLIQTPSAGKCSMDSIRPIPLYFHGTHDYGVLPRARQTSSSICPLPPIWVLPGGEWIINNGCWATVVRWALPLQSCWAATAPFTDRNLWGRSMVSCASRVVPRFDIRVLRMVYGPRSTWTENTVAGDATVLVIQRIALKESTLMVGKGRANNITRKKNERKIKRNIQNPPNKGVGAAATRTDISIHLSNITGKSILLLH